jgi:hypothetical protein
MTSHLMSSLTIPSSDGRLQGNVLRWLSEHEWKILPERSMRARTSQTFGYNGLSDTEKDTIFFRSKGSFHICTSKKRVFLVQYDDQA